MKKKKNNIENLNDFKVISVLLIGIMIFFTISYFKYLPLDILNLKMEWFSKGAHIYYFILTELIAILLSVIFIIVYMKKTEKELRERYKLIGLGLGAIILYYLFQLLEAIPLIICGIDVNTMSLTSKVIYLIIYLIITASIICLLYRKKLKKDIIDYKKNGTKYFSENGKYWIISLVVMVISNFFIQKISSNGIAGNEQAIRDIMKISPIYIFFSAALYSPIIEELIFRQSIKNIFSNKWVFIIVSGFVFGGLHAITDFQSLTDLLFIIPYSAPGIAFAYMLNRTDNIIVPMSFHFIHNGILLSIQFISMMII